MTAPTRQDLRPPAAAGPRMDWDGLPVSVLRWVSASLGSPVVAARTQVGGFSPGVAARVRCANRSRAFVKATGSSGNPDTPALHRKELTVLARLEHPVVPRLLDSYDDGDWVALLLEDVDGSHPALPWRRDELALVLDAVASLGPMAVDGLLPAADEFDRMLGYWVELADRPPADLDPWVRQHLDRLAALAGTPMSRDGNTLLHLDLRADNLLLTPDGQVRVVDWAHATTGAAWVDVVVLLLEVGAYGGFDVEELLARHPLTRGADVAQVTQLVLAMSGMFEHKCRQPAPPGLPTIRQFQRAYARVATGWLRRRLGW